MKIKLYVNCMTDFSIVDDAGKVYTPEQARAIWGTEQVEDFNLAFGRLTSMDFDIDRLRRFYSLGIADGRAS